MSDEEEHSESEFYYPDELEFLDNSDLTETNHERLGERENEGNSQRPENISTLFVIKFLIVTKIKIILDRKKR